MIALGFQGFTPLAINRGPHPGAGQACHDLRNVHGNPAILPARCKCRGLGGTGMASSDGSSEGPSAFATHRAIEATTVGLAL